MTQPTATPAFIIVAKYVLEPADVIAFKAIIVRMVEKAREHAGNVFLNAAQDAIDPNAFHLIEGWISREAADEHLQSDGFQTVLQEALALRILERSGTIFFVAGMQALDMPT